MSGLNKENTKIRILAIYRMLEHQESFITTDQILSKLEKQYGISADRKTIYSDIAAIDRFIPIEMRPRRGGGYRLWDVLGGCERGE